MLHVIISKKKKNHPCFPKRRSLSPVLRWKLTCWFASWSTSWSTWNTALNFSTIPILNDIQDYFFFFLSLSRGLALFVKAWKWQCCCLFIQYLFTRKINTKPTKENGYRVLDTNSRAREKLAIPVIPMLKKHPVQGKNPHLQPFIQFVAYQLR